MSNHLSKYMIASYSMDRGDKLLVSNAGVRDDGEDMIALSVACPHRDDKGYITLTVDIPESDLLDILDDLREERVGPPANAEEEEDGD